MRRLVWTCALVLAWVPGLIGYDYLTSGGGIERTGWLRDERIFTTANVKDIRLLWKIKLDAEPREMHQLFAPLVIERLAIGGVTKEVAIVAAAQSDLFALDVATGQVVWKTRLVTEVLPPSGTLCPGGQTALPTIVPGTSPGQYTIFAIAGDGYLHQIDAATGQAAAPREKFIAPNAKPYALNYFNGVLYTSVAQGCGGMPNEFIAFDTATRRTSVFQPAGGGLWAHRGVAITADGTVFMGTGDGPFNPAIQNFGNAWVSVKLDANKEFRLVDYFGPPNANWAFERDLDINVTPVPFDYRGRQFLIGTGKECVLYLMDRRSLGGADHRTALDTSPLICNERAKIDIGVWGSVTPFQDPKGGQWLVVPFWGPVARTFKAPVEHSRPERGGVAAFKLDEVAGKWKLTPAWLSRDMDMAHETLVANGIVFTFGSGEDIRQGGIDRAWNEPSPQLPTYPNATAGSARRIFNSTHATIFALDALTGKELWNSGRQVTSFSHFAGMTVANGRIYLPTYGGDLYAFGVAR